jgi:hypothetical protein
MKTQTLGQRLDVIALWAIVAVALAYAAITTVAASIQLADELRSGTTTLLLLSDRPLDVVSEGTAVIVAGTYETALVDVTGLSSGVVTTHAIGLVLWMLCNATIALSVSYLAFALLRGRPFARSAVWTIGVAACALGGLGTVAQFASGLANMSAITEIAGYDDAGLQFATVFDLTPLFAGGALIVVAGAFELGRRLQRDTAGLV